MYITNLVPRADAHRQDEPDGSEDPGRQRDRGQIVAGRPPQILLHLPVGRARQVVTDSTDLGSDQARMTPAEPIATSVPAPIAIPPSP